MGEYMACSTCAHCKGGKMKVCNKGHKIKTFQWIADCNDWKKRGEYNAKVQNRS